MSRNLDPSSFPPKKVLIENSESVANRTPYINGNGWNYPSIDKTLRDKLEKIQRV